mgnify:CR=1 FL=1
MTLAVTVLKMTESEVVVKVAGNGGDAVTIDLQTTLLASTQALNGDTQTVTITGVRWQGELQNALTVTRNSVRVLTLPTESADQINFDGQELPPENTGSTYDIVVGQSGTGYAELYLKLKKVSGYKSKVETAEYGAYDDESRVGASTTLSGSPDKV